MLRCMFDSRVHLHCKEKTRASSSSYYYYYHHHYYYYYYYDVAAQFQTLDFTVFLPNISRCNENLSHPAVHCSFLTSVLHCSSTGRVPGIFSSKVFLAFLIHSSWSFFPARSSLLSLICAGKV